MDRHDVAHYGLALLLGASGVGGYVSLTHKSVDSFSVNQEVIETVLKDAPKREVAVMCAPGCGGRAKALAKVFVDAGWPAKAEPGMLSDPDTLHIFTKDRDIYPFAEALQKASGLSVLFFDQDPDGGKPIEILVGPIGDAK